MLLYFLITTWFFGTLLKFPDCWDPPATSGQFLPLAFLQLTGIVDQSSADTTTCLWISSFGILIGVYFSLPMFGAIVLVRLMAPKGAPPNISKHFIVTMREGVPCLQVSAERSELCLWDKTGPPRTCLSPGLLPFLLTLLSTPLAQFRINNPTGRVLTGVQMKIQAGIMFEDL